MNIQGLLKQAQQMQANVGRVEKELAASIYQGSAGGEAVKVEVNGAYEVKSVEVKDELLNKDSKDMLQDMILAAMNNALSKAKKDREEKMGEITQGIKLPGGF